MRGGMYVSGAKGRATIVGAGMSGAMAAIFLARRGYEVDVFELRGDIRNGYRGASRSLNMTLSLRGLEVLKEVELLDSVRSITVPVHGRLIYSESNKERFLPYGDSEEEILYAVERNALNGALLTKAEAFPNVRIHFKATLVDLDTENCIARFRRESTGHLTEAESDIEAQSDIVIGADGTFSKVRRLIHRGRRADYAQEFLDWDYRELRVPAGPGGQFLLNPHALNLWPHGDCMLMALPNTDGSFNCICSMPAEGDPSFANLDTEAAVLDFFNARFPKIVSLIPDLARQFLQNPQSAFLTTRTNTWFHEDRVVLVGDAAHTVVPFMGQGMIAAFEDCSVLNRCLDRHDDDFRAAFAEYQEVRKPNTDALAQLSINNFVELRDTIRSPNIIARKRSYELLHRLFPRFWRPLYSMIAHSRMPYAEALSRHAKQERIARWLGLDLLVAAFALSLRLSKAANGWLGNGVKGHARGR